MADRSTVQEIKEKLAILDVVQPYVKIVRAGKHWKGISPFTKEKTPSFFVSPERGTYYCFSSSQGGDMFTFIEKMEGVDFKGALKILAEKAGVDVRYEHGVDRSHNDRLREALARAELFFVSAMRPGEEAYVYAKKRGLTEETIRSWRLGYVPSGWRTLLDTLTAAGFSIKELSSAGLIKEADGKAGTWYDRFRNRLIFPIRDSAGRTIAFTGRALVADEQAKYLNSPETELFQKSEVIFGLDRAKDTIRTRGFILLVEGQMDVLHCHQAGFTNAVALSGTALTSKHIALFKRYADNLMLVLDNDRAGLAATARAASIALAAGMRVKVVSLPEGSDPADLLLADSHAFTARITGAKSVIEFFLAYFVEHEKDQHRLVLAVEKTVIPLVATVQSPLEREHFINIVARFLSISPESVRDSVSKKKNSIPNLPNSNDVQKKDEQKSKTSVSRLSEALAAIITSYPDTGLAKQAISEYARIVGEKLPEPSERAVFEMELSLGDDPSADAADELLSALERAVLREQYAAALSVLRRAQAAGEPEEESRAEEQCAELLKCLAAFS